MYLTGAWPACILLGIGPCEKAAVGIMLGFFPEGSVVMPLAGERGNSGHSPVVWHDARSLASGPRKADPCCRRQFLLAVLLALVCTFFAAACTSCWAQYEDPLNQVHTPIPTLPKPDTGGVQAPPGGEPPGSQSPGSQTPGSQAAGPNYRNPYAGSQPASASRPAETIMVHSNLVLVPVVVTDSMGRLVTGLEKQNFAVYEDKALQRITSFSSQDMPVSIGIIFDLSGSMADKINRARDSIVDFLQSANPRDEYFVIGFNNRPELMEDFTSDVTNIEARLMTVHPQHMTALLDAIYFGLSKMKQARYPRRALIIVSDGGDNHSRFTEGEVKSLVRESDVQIFALGIFDQYAATIEEQMGPILLNDIAEETGGQLFRVTDLADMGDIATKISDELRNEYVLGYVPQVVKHDGKWRKLKVKLMPPPGLPQLFVHARSGYYAPSQ